MRSTKWMNYLIKKCKKYLLTTSVLLLLSTFCKAQYPVQVIPQLVSPYTLNFSDYYIGSSPKLIVTLINRDMMRPTVNVKLRMTISGQAATIKTNDFGTYPSITLNAGVPERLSMSDLAPYFNANNLDFIGTLTKAQFLQTNKLPEGFYTFCFQAVEVNTNNIVSENTCSTVWISLSDPPMLNLPLNGSSQNISNITNISFTWVPKHLNSPNGAFNTEYVFELKEILDRNIDVNAAFNTIAPLYATTTDATSLIYGPSQPVLVQGRKYAWRVRVKAKDVTADRDDFKNNGYSEIFWFETQQNCDAPTNYNIKTLNETTVSIGFTNAQNITNYFVEYRQTTPSMGDWVKTAFTNSNPITISNLNPGSNYQFKVASSCAVNQSTYGTTQQYSMPSISTSTLLGSNSIKIKGKATWAYYNKGEKLPTTTNPFFERGNESTQKNCSITKDTSIENKFNLPNAKVTLYRINVEQGKKEIGNAFSDENGDYVISVPKTDVLNQTVSSRFEIEVTTPSNNFTYNGSASVKTKSSTNFSAPTSLTNLISSVIINGQSTKVSLDSTQLNYNITSFAKNFQYLPTITSNDSVVAKTSKFKIEILLSENDWNTTYSKLPISKGKSIKGRTSYNNVNYVILDTLGSSYNYHQLLQNYNYIAKINTDGGNVIYKLINAQTSYCKLTEKYNFTFYTTLKGIVKINGLNKENVEIKLTVNGKEYTTKSTTDGYYSFDTLPRVQNVSATMGQIWLLTITDLSTRKDPFTDFVSITSPNVNTKNINLINSVYTFIGKLIDQNKLPVANALIDVDGEVQNNRTSKDGFFIFKTNYLNNRAKTITFKSNGYNDAKIIIDSNTFKSLTGNIINYPLNNEITPQSDWINAITNAKTIDDYIASSNPSFNKNTQLNAEFLGYGFGSLSDVYKNLVSNNNDKPIGICNYTKIEMQNTNERVKFSIKLNNTGVSTIATINAISNSGVEKVFGSYTTSATEDFVFTAPAGKYKITLMPTSETTAFLPLTSEFTLAQNSNGVRNITLLLQDGVLLKGTVKDVEGKNLDSTTVSVEDLPYTCETDKQGFYNFYIPKNKQLKIHVQRRGYNSVDSINTFKSSPQTINFTLKAFDKGFTPIYTLAGYKIELEKQDANGSNTDYKISGKLIVEKNDVFEPVNGFQKLVFKNVAVKVNPTSNDAKPLGEMAFEKDLIDVKSFGFAVQAEGVRLNILSTTATATNFSPGFISAKKINATFITNLPYFPTKDVTLRDKNLINLNGNNVSCIYVSPKTAKPEGFDSSKTYSLRYLSVIGDGLTKFAQLIDFGITDSSSVISQRGLNLSGFLKLPPQPGSVMDNDGRINFSKFTVTSENKIIDLAFELDDNSNRFMVNLQKIALGFSYLSLEGMGTSNFKIKVGGKVWLMRKTTTTITKAVVTKDGNKVNVGTKTTNKISTEGLTNEDALNIKELSFEKNDAGMVLSGKIGLPKDGFTIKDLNVSTPNDGEIGLSYNTGDKSFSLSITNLQISYKKKNSANKLCQMLFSKPIEIQEFRLNTKKWDVFLQSKANIKIDFKMMEINLTKLLVNVGYKMDWNKAMKFLEDANKVNILDTPPDNGPEGETMDENNTDWAIGIEGGVAFGKIKNIAEVNARLLLGTINNQFNIRIGKIGLKIEQPNVFKLAISVELGLTDERYGFDAYGELEVLKKGGLNAHLKFFYYPKSNAIELAASLEVKLPAPFTLVEGIAPVVAVHAIGGGFSVNTKDNKYSVMLSGEFNTPNTPKEAFYLDVDTLQIEFAIPPNKNTCQIPNMPSIVVSLHAGLVIKNDRWCNVTGSIDFCKFTILLKIDCQPKIIPGIEPVKINGTLFAMAPGLYSTQPGMVFLGVNASVDLFGFANANAAIALGINANNFSANVPPEVKSYFNLIDDEAKDEINRGSNFFFGNYDEQKFNGIYASVDFELPRQYGKYDIDIWTPSPLPNVRFSADYDMYVNGKAKLFYKFSTNTLKASASLYAYVNASAKVDIKFLSCSLGGGASALGNIQGGYDNKWYLRGALSVEGYLYWGNGYRLNCNDVDYTIFPLWKARFHGFKACKKMNLDFNFTQGSSPSYSINF